MENIKKFEHDYTYLFLERFIYSNSKLENFKTEEEKRNCLASLIHAFNYLIEQSDRLNIGTIRTLGTIINSEKGIEGLRRTYVTAGEYANFEPIYANQIPNSLNQLFYHYYNIWDDLDIFLKESMFHINYMRIHPLEDGNKRSARLILATNLCKQGLSPIIITEDDTKEYYDYINNKDYEGLAEFIKIREKIESNMIQGFFMFENNIPLLDAVDEQEIKSIPLILRKK